MNGPGLSPGLLRPVKDTERLPKWLPAGKSLLVPCARNALYLGIKVMGLKKGDGVLLPAFVCDTVSLPLERAGARLQLFNVFRDGSFDWEDAAGRIDDRTKAVLYYHYLGLPFGLEEAVSFAKKHGLMLIEDCAHALFSDCGKKGDIAVFSIRKTIPVDYSAALVVNNPRFRTPVYRPNRAFSPEHLAFLKDTENHHHRLFLQSLDTRIPVVRQSFMERIRNDPGFYHDPSRLFPLDALSLLVAHNVDPDAIRAKRRANYCLYLRRLQDMAHFKSLPQGACPLAFPIVVGKERDRFKERLEREGIEPARYWPGKMVPKGAYKRFGDTAWLADHTLTLPCHQDLSMDDVEYVCRRVTGLS